MKQKKNQQLKSRTNITEQIASHWPNGQIEGQNTKLKLVKRQMYCWAEMNLLEAWLLPTAQA